MIRMVDWWCLWILRWIEFVVEVKRVCDFFLVGDWVGLVGEMFGRWCWMVCCGICCFFFKNVFGGCFICFVSGVLRVIGVVDDGGRVVRFVWEEWEDGWLGREMGNEK